MGQYYRGCVIDDEGNIKVLVSYAYGNGAKLMEHAYIKNQFTNAAYEMINEKPMRVAWVGDYSKEYDGYSVYEKKLPQEQMAEYYDKVWKYIWDEEDVKDDGVRVLPEGCEGYYLVNLDMHEYVDMAQYYSRNLSVEKWEGYIPEDKIGEERKYHHWITCIDPLALLTACGNGRGGGDYHDRFPDYRMVGSWAFDHIMLTKNKPEGFKCIVPHFEEKEGK